MGQGQVMLPAYSMSYVSAHVFWKWMTTTISDIIIANLYAGSYLCMTPEKELSEAGTYNKEKKIQACLERRRTFTPTVYSVDGFPGAEYLAAQRILAALLRFKLKQEYFKMCGFVWARMSVAIVRSNRLLLPGPWEKEAQIC